MAQSHDSYPAPDPTTLKAKHWSSQYSDQIDDRRAQAPMSSLHPCKVMSQEMWIGKGGGFIPWCDTERQAPPWTSHLKVYEHRRKHVHTTGRLDCSMAETMKATEPCGSWRDPEHGPVGFRQRLPLPVLYEAHHSGQCLFIAPKARYVKTASSVRLTELRAVHQLPI